MAPEQHCSRALPVAPWRGGNCPCPGDGWAHPGIHIGGQGTYARAVYLATGENGLAPGGSAAGGSSNASGGSGCLADPINPKLNSDYKPSRESGTHTGRLWDSNGNFAGDFHLLE